MSDHASVTGQRSISAAATNTTSGPGTNDLPATAAGKPAGQAAASTRAGPKGPSPVPGASSRGPKTFEFVLVTDSESRRQVRRHAMRQYVHQRRLEGIARLESSRVPVSGWIKGNPTGKSEISPKVEEVDDDEHIHAFGNIPEEDGRDISHIKRQQLSSLSFHQTSSSMCDSWYASEFQLVMSADPMAAPSPSSSDPFNSYPIKLNQTDHSLIHHFVNTYPQMMYKMGDPQQENPIRTIFHQLALHDVVSFQAMLAVAAKHQAGVEGRSDSVLSLTHKMRALRLINQHLQSGASDQTDGILYAVASMAVIEKWSKDGNVERMHFQGVRHLIRKRGGMRTLRVTSRFMENVLYWVDFSCAPKAIFDASLPWTGTVPDIPPPTLPFLAPPLHVPPNFKFPPNVNDEDAVGIMQSCEDFLAFFRSLNELQYSLLSQPLPPCHGGTPVEGPKLFGPSSPLYAVLTSLPDYDHGIRDVRFIDEYTCMACLLYLGVALHDYYYTSRNFNGYLEWLNNELVGSGSRLNAGVATLLWVFLNNGGFPAGETPDAGERSWFVSRMLRVAKRLEWTHAGTIWDSLRSILIQFLIAQQECELGSDQISEAALIAREKRLSSPTYVLWDEAEMRRNILGPLYGGPPVFTPSAEWEYTQDIYAPSSPGNIMS